MFEWNILAAYTYTNGFFVVRMAVSLFLWFRFFVISLSLSLSSFISVHYFLIHKRQTYSLRFHLIVRLLCVVLQSQLSPGSRWLPRNSCFCTQIRHTTTTTTSTTSTTRPFMIIALNEGKKLQKFMYEIYVLECNFLQIVHNHHMKTWKWPSFFWFVAVVMP